MIRATSATVRSAGRSDSKLSTAIHIGLRLAGALPVYSILHISDLHRSPEDTISNAELISALVSDRRRYENEPTRIKAPDAIVVSGDIIQGVRMDAADADVVLAAQYATAREFLAELADRFVDGDRSKVVLVPGNHDINWARARSSMEVVASNDPSFPMDVRGALANSDSAHRWDWKTRELLEIKNHAVYQSRMDAFWDFFESFYAGTGNLLKVGRGQVANLYSLWNGRIGLAAFDSCHGNDCYAFHGRIPKEAIGRAYLDLLDKGGFGLLLAVWHHNIEGPPHRSDYMDIDIVRGMIGRGFRLGLYGHQHRPDATPIQINLATKETMALVSAGSLCAGARELPTGAVRGYNIIEINEDLAGARVHFREMSVANLFTPARRTSLGGASFVDLKWDLPPDLPSRAGGALANDIVAVLELGERELKSGRPDECKRVLLPLAETLPEFGRQLLLEAARETHDLAMLLDLLKSPRSVGELIELADAYMKIRDFAKARAALDTHGERLGIEEPTSRELRARISVSEAIAK